MQNETEPVFVDDRALERRTSIKRVTWQVMRARGRGPAYSKLGRRVIYRWADVVAWIDAQRVAGGGM